MCGIAGFSFAKCRGSLYFLNFVFAQKQVKMHRTLLLLFFCNQFASTENMQPTRTCAEQGNADSQNQLGLMYYNGDSITQSDEKAAYWFRKAAVQGDVMAHALEMMGNED